jgi:TrmH family RNA methyltransferase
MTPTRSPARERLRAITGKHNPLLKELRHAFAHGGLAEDGSCAIEGVRILEEAIRSGLRFRAVFFSDAAAGRIERLLPQIGAKVETLLVPDKLFASAVPSDSPQGVAALVHCKEFTLQDALRKTKPELLLGVAGLQDPGNLGTLIRSAEAFGAGGVLLGENTVSPFNPKAVRATAGSVFRLPVLQVQWKETVATLKDQGVRLLATSSHKGTPLPETDLTGPVAVLIGGEGAGLPKELLGAMDEVVAIPHAPQVESLNAGVAASIVLYEAARQRKSRENGRSTIAP